MQVSVKYLDFISLNIHSQLNCMFYFSCFEKPVYCLFIVAAQIYIPPIVHKCFSSHILYQYLLSLAFYVGTILTGARWHLTVAVISISVMISDVQHLYMNLMAIWMSSLEKKYLFRSSVHIFKLELFLLLFLLLICTSSLHNLDIDPLKHI